MKSSLRNCLVLVLVLTLVMSLAITAAAADPAGINVQYNGSNIVFKDASPKIINGRTMVPFRQILETMGAEVTYEQSSHTVLAKAKDKEFSFAIGGKDINISKNGKTVVKKMDVAPILDQNLNRTYVPVRFMAESMGYSVGWDDVNKTAVIIDPASLFKNADQDFSVLAKLLNSDIDLEKAYASTGNFAMTLSAADPSNASSNIGFALNGTMSGIQQKSNADMLMTLNINADQSLSSMSPEEQAQMKIMLDAFKNTTMQIKMDGDNGVMYMKSNLFTFAIPGVDENTWLKMNIFEMYDKMGVNLRPMMTMSSSNSSLSEKLQTVFSSMGNIDASTYQKIETGYTFLKNLMGNDAFKLQTSGNTNTYTLNVDQAAIIAALGKTALAGGMAIDSTDLAEVIDVMQSSDIKMNIVIKDQAGVLESYKLNGSGSGEDYNFILNMSGTQKSTDFEMTMEQPGLMKMVFSMDSNITETTKIPDLQLPSGAKIIDFNTIMPANMNQ